MENVMGRVVIILCLSLFSSATGQNEFNVMDYGAIGDGSADDTMAFAETWNRTCSAEEGANNATMMVPQNKTFLIHLITFTGPCKPHNITILVAGTVVGPESPDAWLGKDQGRWIVFKRLSRLYIRGQQSGIINGRGQLWWSIHCRTNPHLQGCIKLAPTTLSFIDSNEITVSNISFVNSPQTHILASSCNNINLEFLDINSPESSPNTDGIHLDRSHQVSIVNSKISCGDDCVSIGDYTSNVLVSNIYCGPGHGVSIGSLGRSGNEVQVENVTVQDVHFNGTTNGARIKTWQSGRGYVQGVTYRRLNFTDVRNPLVIDQYYCDVRGACKPTQSGVHVNSVHFEETYGTSRTKIAINLNCSEVVPCTDILLDSIQISSSTNPGERLLSACSNVFGYATGVVEPPPCLPPPPPPNNSSALHFF